MTEYIDRDILFEQIRLTANRSCLGETSVAEISAMEIVNVIASLPKADVEPVKHSFWKNNNLYVPNLGECDVCGYEHYNADELKYCPNCGAKMDGEDV